MKGVIVQAGEPKSIVLFNNGKIRAIPTPPDCHVGMVVSVKFNDRLKIAAISAAALAAILLLLALGVFIGAGLKKERPSAIIPSTILIPQNGSEAQNLNRGFTEERGRQFQTATVSEAKNLEDDTRVTLTGNIVESLGDKKYIFRDSTGEITVEIERRILRALSGNISGDIEISGEVDIEHGEAVIDVKSVKKL